MSYFERLTALDASFLDLEGPRTPMHLAATLIFDRRPMLGEDGVVDMDRLRKVVSSRLSQTPRLRMKLAQTRLTGHPVWVDDPDFRLEYHLRHLALPPPGTIEQLREMVGQVLSQQLDRGKPLWEVWVVDGLEGDRLAAICKMHHCLMDGMAGVGAMSVVLSPECSAEVPPDDPWEPRPSPRPETLLAADLLRRAAGTRALVGRGVSALRNPMGSLEEAREGATSVLHALREGLTPASDTPLNRPLGPHRSVRWLRVDLSELKRIKNALGGTVNDVVVATVAGAMRQFLEGRGLAVDKLQCRAMFPVNVRTRTERGQAGGNRLAAIGGNLPVHIANTRRRYETVRDTTLQLKDSPFAYGTELLNQLSDWVHGSIITEAQRMAQLSRAYNVVITNIPGPQIPLYMLEAPMLEVYPTLPLFRNQGLSVAVFSYAGALYWGLTADRSLVPDLEDFAQAVAAEVQALGKAAG